MFTMAKVRIGVTYLDEHLVENDYYSEKEKVVGQWYGKAAQRMGIEGRPIEAGDEAFGRLRENLHPVTGEKLTPRTNEFREASYVAELSTHSIFGHCPMTAQSSTLETAKVNRSKLCWNQAK
jgi:hypothetical protein